MTPSAWIMFGATVSVVSFFTAWFFVKVMRTPPLADSDG